MSVEASIRAELEEEYRKKYSKKPRSKFFMSTGTKYATITFMMIWCIVIFFYSLTMLKYDDASKETSGGYNFLAWLLADSVLIASTVKVGYIKTELDR